MRKQKHAMDLRLVIGECLAAICLIHAIANIFTCLAAGRGILMLANIVAAIGIAAVMVTVLIYHGELEIMQIPVIMMAIFLGNDILRVFCVSWSYLFFCVPIALLIIQVLSPDWSLWGIAAGAAMIVFNLVAGIISLYFGSVMVASQIVGNTAGQISSMYIASLLMNNNSLMGIACILFFCIVPKETPKKYKPHEYGNRDDFGHGYGGGGFGDYGGGFHG